MILDGLRVKIPLLSIFSLVNDLHTLADRIGRESLVNGSFGYAMLYLVATKLVGIINSLSVLD